jgi:hypothetical protein
MTQSLPLGCGHVMSGIDIAPHQRKPFAGKGNFSYLNTMATESRTQHGSSRPRAAPRAAPSCAVVLLAASDRSVLEGTLAVGAPICDALGVGLWVLHADAGMEREMATRFPSVCWLTTATGATDAERRAIGFRAAGTDLVLFAGLREMADPGWLAALGARREAEPRPSIEPTPEWVTLLADRGVPGALGEV